MDNEVLPKQNEVDELSLPIPKEVRGFGLPWEQEYGFAQAVEEVLYVTDMEKAFAAAGPVRKEAYGSSRPAVSSTIVVTPRLSLPTQLIEIKFIARLVGARDRSTSRSPL